MIANSASLDGWVKSSYSGVENACVEWAPDHAAAYGAVPVRDSKNPYGPALSFDTLAWTAFIAAIKSGDFGA
ncbi:DUF397 domain-containing protein [Streptomyces buecherae]|uniref:DUF397 domain-containing protein n=1 Tax=Streptomyces buecherae TaxID=2763006 RepID=UPI0033FD9F24